MDSKWTGLRAIREEIQPEPSEMERKYMNLKEDIIDIKLTLQGGILTKHRQALELELTRKKGELKAMIEYDNRHCLPGHEVPMPEEAL